MDLQPASSPAKGSVIGIKWERRRCLRLRCQGALYIFVPFDPIKERKADLQRVGDVGGCGDLEAAWPASENCKPGLG